MNILAYSKWDAIPAILGVLHFCYVLAFFALLPNALGFLDPSLPEKSRPLVPENSVVVPQSR